MGVVTTAQAVAISGTTTKTTWQNYSTKRTATSAGVSFNPSNLLYQGGSAQFLGLKLINPEGGRISNPTYWYSTGNRKSIISGLATGTEFRLSACCYSTTGKDSYWAGSLIP